MIKVLKSGLYTTLQDKGRYGHRSKGLPISGSMDQESARFANTILGNDLNDCVIEFTAIAPSLEFKIATQIAVTGAKLSVFINGKPEARNCLLDIKKGDILTFSSIIIGWRGYIAVKNGFDTEVVLSSKSQYKGLTCTF